jgi:hypothetical protein
VGAATMSIDPMPTVARGLSATEVHALSVESLRLDSNVLDLEAPESLAALARRAASFVTPCPPRFLRETVLRALRGVLDTEGERRAELRTTVDEMIESIVAYGDLLELPTDEAVEGELTRNLYFAPPTFVALDGVVFLIGGLSDGVDALPTDLRAAVEHRNHTRRLRSPVVAEIAERLRATGWIELRRDMWLAEPRSEAPGHFVARADAALMASPTTGAVPGLIVLDPDTPPTYYPGRWVEPRRKSGRFIARREQRYGADLWSYVELSEGTVTRLTDLPWDSPSAPGRPCDAAWHLQMAIDALAGHPQLFRLRPKPPEGSVIVDFFSPVPLWAKRRWDVLGEEVPRNRSLFAYRFSEAEFEEVLRSLEGELWLRVRTVS